MFSSRVITSFLIFVLFWDNTSSSYWKIKHCALKKSRQKERDFFGFVSATFGTFESFNLQRFLMLLFSFLVACSAIALIRWNVMCWHSRFVGDVCFWWRLLLRICWKSAYANFTVVFKKDKIQQEIYDWSKDYQS